MILIEEEDLIAIVGRLVLYLSIIFSFYFLDFFFYQTGNNPYLVLRELALYVSGSIERT